MSSYDPVLGQACPVHLLLRHLMCVCIRQAITADAYPLPENLVSESGRLRLNEEVVNAQGSIPRP